MPERLYYFTDQPDIAAADFPDRVVVIGSQLRQRPLDTATQTMYSSSGRRLPAIVELAEVKAEGISSLFGFHVEYSANGGSVGVQLSTDGGITWQRWNGSAWISDASFSTQDQIEQGLPTLPLPSPKRLRVRLKLTPAVDGLSGPTIDQVSIFYELSYQWEKDLLRSLKHYLESRLQYAAVAQEQFESGQVDPPTDRVTIDPPVVPVAPVEAYNLTDDPGMLTNIATVVSGQDVLLSAPQVGLVEVRFQAKPPIFTTANASLQKSASTAILIEVVSMDENRSVRTNDKKIDWRRVDAKARLRPQPVWEIADLKIQAQCPLKAETESMVEALETVLQYEITFPAEASGETFIVKGFAPVGLGDVIGEGLFAREALLRVTGRHWLSEPFVEVPLATEVDITQDLIVSPSLVPLPPEANVPVEVVELQIGDGQPAQNALDSLNARVTAIEVEEAGETTGGGLNRQVVLTFSGFVPAGTAFNIQDGTYSGGSATLDGDVPPSPVTLPASGALFVSNGEVEILLNGIEVMKGSGLGVNVAQWVSAIQLALSVPVYDGDQITVRSPA